MQTTKKEFSIANVNFKIKSNFEIEDLLYEPQPYNLHINYLIKNKVEKGDLLTITIIKNSKKLLRSRLLKAIHMEILVG